MLILKKNINIQIKKLIKSISFFSLFFLSGCTSALPKEIEELFSIRKENCWPCSGFKALWDSLATIAENAFVTVSGIALNFLGVALLFWIAFTVSKYIVSVKEPNIKEFITTIAGILFKALVIAAILATPNNTLYVLDLVISPVMALFVELSRGILFSDPEIAKNFTAAASYQSITGNHIIFTRDIGNQLQDIVYRVYLGFSSGIGLGARMLISVDILSWACGLLVMFVFIYLMIIIPLIFMEGFVVLGIVMVLFPFFLVSYVFPSTKAMIKEAWHALYIAVAQILITCIYLAVLINVIKTYNDSFSIGKQLTDVLFLTGLKSMTTRSLAFFALIWCMFKMANDIPRMTSFLVGSMNRSAMVAFVQKFTGLAANAGKIIAGAAMVSTGVGSSMGSALMKDGLRESALTIKEGFNSTDPDKKDMMNRFDIGNSSAAQNTAAQNAAAQKK